MARKPDWWLFWLAVAVPAAVGCLVGYAIGWETWSRLIGRL